MANARIEKDIFPGLMMPPFHYACFTRFYGYSEERFFSVHNSFQVILCLEGELNFEIEGEQRVISQGADSVFILSPGIRHRWYSNAEGKCENFMFFCDGFSDSDSDLGRVFNVKRPDVIWHFELEASESQFYVDSFRKLILEHHFCNVNIMHGLLYAFCGLICQKANTLKMIAPQTEQHPALTHALELIHRDYHKKMTLDKLSHHCGLGPSRLSELFRNSFGMSPIQYVNELRLKKAGQLLACSDMNITQIAEYVGFSSVHYFSRFFKSQTGMQPSEIRDSENASLKVQSSLFKVQRY